MRELIIRLQVLAAASASVAALLRAGEWATHSLTSIGAMISSAAATIEPNRLRAADRLRLGGDPGVKLGEEFGLRAWRSRLDWLGGTLTPTRRPIAWTSGRWGRWSGISRPSPDPKAAPPVIRGAEVAAFEAAREG
jgi:hypothetical protein